MRLTPELVVGCTALRALKNLWYYTLLIRKEIPPVV